MPLGAHFSILFFNPISFPFFRSVLYAIKMSDREESLLFCVENLLIQYNYMFLNLTVKFSLSLDNLANLSISLCIRCHRLPPPFLFGSSLTRPRLQNSSFLSRATMDDWRVCEFNHLCSFVFL